MLTVSKKLPYRQIEAKLPAMEEIKTVMKIGLMANAGDI